MYRQVLNEQIEDQLEPVKARKDARSPTVMTQSEVQRATAHLEEIHLLMAKIFYGSGLRLMECVSPQVQEMNHDRKILYVRVAKRGKNRTTVFPQSIQTELQMHLEKVKRHHVVESGLQKVYTHVMEKNISAVSSQLDRLLKADF